MYLDCTVVILRTTDAGAGVGCSEVDGQMSDTAALSDLVQAAGAGDQKAWNELIDRHIPLVFAVARRYRLSDKDCEDVSQTVWLRLLEHLGDIRDPKALPGWLAVTTRNEAFSVLKVRGRNLNAIPLETRERPDDKVDVENDLLRSERNRALRDGMAELTEQQQEFLRLVTADPPLPYAEISRTLGIPIGSIGPTRARYLAKLRSTTAFREYFLAEERDYPAGRRS